jgi:hypothetical protein
VTSSGGVKLLRGFVRRVRNVKPQIDPGASVFLAHCFEVLAIAT